MLDQYDDRVVFAGTPDAEPSVSDTDTDRVVAEAFELAAAEVDLSFGPGDYEPLPDHVRTRLNDTAKAFLSGSSAPQAVAGRIRPSAVPSTTGSQSGSGMVWGGWIAAAACLGLAALGWFAPRAVPTAPGAVQEVAELVTPSEARQALLDSGRELLAMQWNPWSLGGEGPEVQDVTGDVIWDEVTQTGFMRFSGLPSNAESGEVYQLWIIDDRGLFDETGQSARISGGVFSVGPDDVDPLTGEIVVPISAALDVQNAAHFAITIEENGGTWVSDMSRRVVSTL